MKYEAFQRIFEEIQSIESPPPLIFLRVQLLPDVSFLKAFSLKFFSSLGPLFLLKESNFSLIKMRIYKAPFKLLTSVIRYCHRLTQLVLMEPITVHALMEDMSVNTNVSKALGKYIVGSEKV